MTDEPDDPTPPLWGEEWYREVSAAWCLAREVESLRRLYGPDWPRRGAAQTALQRARAEQSARRGLDPPIKRSSVLIGPDDPRWNSEPPRKSYQPTGSEAP